MPIITVMGTTLDIGEAGLSDRVRLAVLENLSDGVYFVDRQRRILYWNKGAEEITGFSAEEVLGHRCKDQILMHCDDNGTVLCGSHCPLLDTIKDGQQREAHVYLHHKDGHRRPVRIRAAALRDDDGHIIGAVETFHDNGALVESRRRAVDLQRDSMYDTLTGVGNRRLGESVLAGYIEQYRRFERIFGVLYIDIDRFKRINDRFGHQVGDAALQLVARTLTDACRQRDEVIRWGGEEFLVLLADADETNLAASADRLRALVSRTRLFADRHLVPLRASIGGTVVAPGDTEDLIIARADALLYASKKAGRNRVTLDIASPEEPPEESASLSVT